MEPLKERYNSIFIDQLADEITKHNSSFSKEKFRNSIFNDSWKDMELKERMRHITHVLHELLPGDFSNNIKVLKKAAPKFGDFTAMFFPDYVEVYGQEEPEISLDALEHFTKYSSSEFAIRPFITSDSKKVMKRMLKWSTHENYHVRRLASEGCRPRLPWAMALPDFKKDPSDILPILENLKNDSSDYVRRSVANNLNDIAKDHPQLVLNIAKDWLGKTKETDWVVKHACRTLLKKGDSRAMSLFGLGELKISISKLKAAPKKVKIGEQMDFSFMVSSKEEKRKKIRLDFGIYYCKANGSRSKKVFKISESQLEPLQSKNIQKALSFKDLTTRKHYPGKHKLVIIVNGKECSEVGFEVI